MTELSHERKYRVPDSELHGRVDYSGEQRRIQDGRIAQASWTCNVCSDVSKPAASWFKPPVMDLEVKTREHPAKRQPLHIFDLREHQRPYQYGL